MRLLVAGFTNTLSDNDFAYIMSLGFDGIRNSIKWGATRVQLSAVIKQYREMKGIVGIWFEEKIKPTPKEVSDFLAYNIYRAKRLGAAKNIIWEIGNEPDLNVKDYTYFSIVINSCAKVAAKQKVDLLVGGISSLNKLTYLERLLPLIPKEVIIGLHPYRQEEKAWKIKEDRVSNFLSLISGRRYGIDEIGWHTLPSKKNWWPCTPTIHWTDYDIRNFARYEILYWPRRGAEFVTWYQLNDGMNAKDSEDHYGIRYLNNVQKPVAAVFSI